MKSASLMRSNGGRPYGRVLGAAKGLSGASAGVDATLNALIAAEGADADAIAIGHAAREPALASTLRPLRLPAEPGP